MNLPLPEIHIDAPDVDEPQLPLATEGVLRYVWHGRFGDMLIEVRGEHSYVNGQAVVPVDKELGARQGAAAVG